MSHSRTGLLPVTIGIICDPGMLLSKSCCDGRGALLWPWHCPTIARVSTKALRLIAMLTICSFVCQLLSPQRDFRELAQRAALSSD